MLNGTGLPLGLGHHRDDRATSSQSLNSGSKPDSSEEDHEPHCEIVHESRASSHTNPGTVSNKQYHVSKVYFYSVSDVLQQEGSTPIGKVNLILFWKDHFFWDSICYDHCYQSWNTKSHKFAALWIHVQWTHLIGSERIQTKNEVYDAWFVCGTTVIQLIGWKRDLIIWRVDLIL